MLLLKPQRDGAGSRGRVGLHVRPGEAALLRPAAMRHTVAPAQLEEHEPLVRALIADFRRHSRALVGALRAPGILARYEAHEECDSEVSALGSRWRV